ncbi:MAG: selenocysteine-specific translation elongation factor [Anaerolineales bacterium]
MRVIGTAGHVDHGKSTLVQALTGIHPDRLKEEREREMTIDLGFAFFTLPNGQEVGIVDVPGHRDFIENMLAGVGGIDAALFVIAADEGVMPQTREHLAILDLLQIQTGVVALTKIDLIDEPDWLNLIEDDVRAALRGTILETAPIIRVSARTRAGLPALTEAIATCLTNRPPRPDLGRPRLPIDRVFTMQGFGTVVTGTLSDGHFELGQDVVIQPDGLRGRVRGLQAHKQKEQYARPGTRTAINLAGVALEEVRRGAWVTLPGQYPPTQRLDLQLRVLPDVQAIRHDLEVKFFIGAAEVLGRIRLLGAETLEPGETGWVQIELREPVIALRGDRYIVRRPSPGETLGGGRVMDPHPKGRHKRFDEAILGRLATLAQGAPEDLLFQAFQVLGAAPAQGAFTHAALGPDMGREALESLLASGAVILLEPDHPEGLIATQAFWEMLTDRARKEVGAYHRQNPLRVGMSREALKSRLKVEMRVFNALMASLTERGEVVTNETLVWRPQHSVQFSSSQTAGVNRLLARFAASPFSPPSVKEAQAEVGVEVYNALVELGQLKQVSPEVVFRKDDFDQLLVQTREMIGRDGEVTVATFRDRFSTSRKYALAFLEYLDALGVTVRSGDARRLKS